MLVLNRSHQAVAPSGDIHFMLHDCSENHESDDVTCAKSCWPKTNPRIEILHVAFQAAWVSVPASQSRSEICFGCCFVFMQGPHRGNGVTRSACFS